MQRMQNVDQHPKSGVYRVRVTYPAHLREILKATGTTKSLGTKDAITARKAAVPVLALLQRRISDAESIYKADATGQVASVSLTLEAGLELIEQWRDDYLRQVARVMTSSEGSCGNYLALGDSPQHDRALLAADSLLMVKLYYSGQPVPSDILNRTLDRILSEAGFVLPGTYRLRFTLVDALRRAITTIRLREVQWKAGDWSSRPPAERNPGRLAGVAEEAKPSDAQVLQRTIRLSSLFDAWVEHAKPKSVTEQQLAMRQLCEFLGNDDPLAHSVNYEHADTFYRVLKWLPKSMTQELRARPLVEIATDMEVGALKLKRAAGATAAKKVQLLSTMFSFAVARGWAKVNPFARVVGKRDAKPQVKRRPMREDDLNSIFTAPLFTGCAGYSDWRQPSNVFVANHRFWLPLLGLVTGMRIEELGQLLVNDVSKDDGVLCIHITEEVLAEKPTSVGPKSVKTAPSVRRVPLHRIALDAGFEKYWQWALSTGQAMLFPELPISGKRTKEVSRWFNRDFRSSVGLHDASRTFHSFRHLFKDRCRAAKHRRDLHDALTGHRDGSAGAGYGDGLSLDDLKAGIDALTFPGFPGVPARMPSFMLLSENGSVVGAMSECNDALVARTTAQQEFRT